nr:hypothetical protein CFP56_69944 [Quercus suber]
MVGNLALFLSAKVVALGFEFGRGVLCEHEAANMSIGGKELNLMVSLTTSEQIKATTNLAQNLDPVKNFLALKLSNKSWTQCLYLISKYIKIHHNFHYCCYSSWDEGHYNNFFEVSVKCEDDPIFVYFQIKAVSAPNVTLILCPYVCWSSLRFFLVQLILVRYLEPLFPFCRLIASMLDSYYFGLLECKIEMAVPYFHLAQLIS